MLDEFGGTLPYVTALLIKVSEFLEAYGLHMILTLLGSILAVSLYFRTRSGARLRARLLMRIPLVGTVLRESNMFFLTNNLTTLLNAGLSPIEAMRLAEEGMENLLMRESLAEVTRVASEGTRLGEAFSQEGSFPVVLTQALTSGEASGGLADTLSGLAEYYELETERAVNWATELIQPIVIMSLAGVVGFVAIAIVAGIYSTLGSVE